MVNRVMDGLTEKPYKHRLEGAEGMSSHVIIWRNNPKLQEEKHMQRPQNMGRTARIEKGMFKRGT